MYDVACQCEVETNADCCKYEQHLCDTRNILYLQCLLLLLQRRVRVDWDAVQRAQPDGEREHDQ